MRPASLLLPLVLALAAAAAALPLADVTVAGEKGNGGIYDPSVEYASVGGTGWLAYSAVSGPELPFGPNVQTHLAKSQDGGASWSFVQPINPSSAPTTHHRHPGRRQGRPRPVELRGPEPGPRSHRRGGALEALLSPDLPGAAAQRHLKAGAGGELDRLPHRQ